MHSPKKRVHRFSQNLREIHYPTKSYSPLQKQKFKLGSPHMLQVDQQPQDVARKKVKRNNSETQKNVPLNNPPPTFKQAGRQAHSPQFSHCGRLNCFTAPSFSAQQLEHKKDGFTALLQRVPRARSVCLISGESEAQRWAYRFRPPTQEVLPVSVLAVACPSVSLVLLFCCALASPHSDQRLLHPEKRERPASHNSCPCFCLYLFNPYAPPILLTDQIL